MRWVKIIISVVLLTVIVWQAGGLGAIGALLARFDPLYVALVLVLYTFDRALMTYKWVRLLEARGLHLPFFRAMKLYCSSMVWGTFLPTTVGADAVRAASAIRTGLDADEVLASIAIERMIGFLSALILGMLGLAQLSVVQQFGEHYTMIWIAAGGTLFLGFLALAASFSASAYRFVYGGLLRRFQGNWIVDRIRGVHLAYLGYQNVKGTILIFFGLTVIEQLLKILECAWLAWGMGIDAGMFQISGAVILTQLLSRVPISIDGIGVYEGLFVLTMGAVGIGVAEATAIAIAGRLLQLISWLPWWLAHMMETGSVRPPVTSSEPRIAGSTPREKR